MMCGIFNMEEFRHKRPTLEKLLNKGFERVGGRGTYEVYEDEAGKYRSIYDWQHDQIILNYEVDA